MSGTASFIISMVAWIVLFMLLLFYRAFAKLVDKVSDLEDSSNKLSKLSKTLEAQCEVLAAISKLEPKQEKESGWWVCKLVGYNTHILFWYKNGTFYLDADEVNVLSSRFEPPELVYFVTADKEFKTREFV